MATANFTTKPPMLDESCSESEYKELGRLSFDGLETRIGRFTWIKCC
jgi:hypothetical protein